MIIKIHNVRKLIKIVNHVEPHIFSDAFGVMKNSGIVFRKVIRRISLESFSHFLS